MAAEGITRKTTGHTIVGSITIPLTTERQILAAKVLNNVVKRVWVFSKDLNPNSPVNGYLTLNNEVVLRPYAKLNAPLNVVADGDRVISYYKFIKNVD